MKNKLPSLHSGENLIGNKIAHQRRLLGLTQNELALRIGIRRSLLADYEQGRARIYDEMIVRIAQALETPINDLLNLKSTDRKQLPTLKLMKRMYEIDKLPPSQQKALLKTIDNFLKGARKS